MELQQIHAHSLNFKTCYVPLLGSVSMSLSELYSVNSKLFPISWQESKYEIKQKSFMAISLCSCCCFKAVWLIRILPLKGFTLDLHPSCATDQSSMVQVQSQTE